MSKNNYLIVLEGADGAGKGTQFEALKKVLIHNKIDYSTYDFPRYDTFWGKNVARFLNGEFGDVKLISPYYKTLFYILDQADASKSIEKDLANGKLVLCNRFVSSNQIFQSSFIKKTEDKNKFLEWLDQAAYKELRIVKPDLVLGLLADPKVAFANIEKKGKRNYTQNLRDENEKNFKLQTQVAKELKRICNVDSTWELVKVTKGSAMRSINEIRDDIIKYINNRLDMDLQLP
jgi:dTMP kinase